MRAYANYTTPHITPFFLTQAANNKAAGAKSLSHHPHAIATDRFDHQFLSTAPALYFQGKHSEAERQHQTLLESILQKTTFHTPEGFKLFFQIFNKLKRPHLPILPGVDAYTQIRQFIELTSQGPDEENQQLRHSCRAELMLLTQQTLLKKPGTTEAVDPVRNKLKDDLFLSELFSMRFFNPDSFLQLLGLAGTINFSFKHFKHDARGGLDSLLRKQGATPLVEGPLDKSFGSGYALDLNRRSPEHFAPGCTVVFRRGFLALIRPQDTIVFRNSSPIFGRDCLPEPLLYTDANLSDNDPSNLNPAKDSRFHALDHTYFDHLNDTELEACEDKLNTCRKNVETFWTQMLRYKLDTNDFTQENGFLGSYKPGFKQLVEHLVSLYTDHEFQKAAHIKPDPLPALEFVDPSLPPTTPYTFRHNGKTYTQFEITPQHLQELEALVKREWSEEEYPNSCLMAFLQAGISNRAVLMLADPEQKTQEIPL